MTLCTYDLSSWYLSNFNNLIGKSVKQWSNNWKMRLISTNWLIYTKDGTKFQIKVVQHKTTYLCPFYLIPCLMFWFIITKLAFHSVCNSTVHFKTLIFHHEHFYFHSWKVAILKILVCTMNPKPCCSGWNFPIIILHGISTIEVNWFNPKLLFDLPRKLFTILELSRRCPLYHFSCTAFSHFKNSI